MGVRRGVETTVVGQEATKISIAVHEYEVYLLYINQLDCNRR